LRPAHASSTCASIGARPACASARHGDPLENCEDTPMRGGRQPALAPDGRRRIAHRLEPPA
jgi:hypothetical protein